MSAAALPAEQQKRGLHTYFNLLRGSAAQLVLFGHALTIGNPEIRGNFYYIQAFGVVLLIMISGYLIAGSVRRRVDSGTFSFWTFMRDRGIRIFIPLLPTIPLVILMDKLILPAAGSAWSTADHSIRTIIYQVFLLNDNHILRRIDIEFGTDLFERAAGSNAPLWAVALEWWLYVGFAAFVALTVAWKRTKYRWIVVLLAGFAAGSVLFSMVHGNYRPLGWIVTAGCGWYILKLRNIPRAAWWALGALGLAMIAITMATAEGGVYMPPTALGAGILIVAIARSVPLGGLSVVKKPSDFMAKYAYSLFLVHYPVLVYMEYLDFPQGAAFVVFGVALSNLIALGWWWLFERPAIALKDKLARKEKSEQLTTAA